MDQIEFQLKLHTLQQIIQTKQSELQVVQAKLDKVRSIRIESQDEILQLITDVHKTIKNIEWIVLEIRDPCYQLSMNSLYDLFKNICYTMFNSIRLLADGCQNGVQRNLFKYAPAPRNQLISQTVCIQKENDCNNQIRTQLKQKQQFYSETRAQLQINRIYMSVQAQKQAVMKTFPSNVVTKLNQVRENWIKIINDSDKILQEAYNRENEGTKQNLAQRLHKPQYVTKVLKEELFETIKNSFKNTVQKTLKRMYNLFYQTEYKKIKEQIQRPNKLKKESEAQTQIQGMNKIKQLQRQRKHHEKVLKQLQQLKSQKNKINHQYTIAVGNNQLYLNRIQELERKLLGCVPINLRSFDRRSSHDKKIQSNKRNSVKHSRQSISKDKQDNQKIQFNSKFNLIYNNQSQINNITVKNDEEEGKSDQNIIRKRNKLKRVYSKSRLHTQHTKQKQGYSQKSVKDALLTHNTNLQSTQEVRNGEKQLKQQQIYQNPQYQNIHKQIQSLSIQQLKTAVTQILQFTDQIRRSQNFNTIDHVKQNLNTKDIIQTNKYVNRQHKTTYDTTKKIQNTSFHQMLADRIVSNTSMKGILGGLFKKAIMKNKQENKQTKERLSINVKSQAQSQQKCNQQGNQSSIDIKDQQHSKMVHYFKEFESLASEQKIIDEETRKININRARHSKQQSSFLNLNPKNIKKEIKIIKTDKNYGYHPVQMGKNLKKTFINQKNKQLLGKNIKNQQEEYDVKIQIHRQREDSNKQQKQTVKQIQKSYQKKQMFYKTSHDKRYKQQKNSNMFQNLNISQFNNNLLRVKLKQTLTNTISSINSNKIQHQKTKKNQTFEQNNLNKLITIKPIKLIAQKQRKWFQKNKITKDIIQICKTLLKGNSNSQLQNALGHYIQVNLINPGIDAIDQTKRKYSSKLLKNRMETQ